MHDEMTKAQRRLSDRQLNMLLTMAGIGGDKAWLVQGHNRSACHKLVYWGLAEHVGGDGLLSGAYVITSAGLALLRSLRGDAE